MSFTKECENCGGEFTAQRETAKYCSDSCKMQSCRSRKVVELQLAEQEEIKNEILQIELQKLELIQLEMELKNESHKRWQDFENLKELDRQQKIQDAKDKKNEELKKKYQNDAELRLIKSDQRRIEDKERTKKMKFITEVGLGIILKLFSKT